MIFFDIDRTLLDYDAAERNGISHFSQEYNDIFLENELEATKQKTTAFPPAVVLFRITL